MGVLLTVFLSLLVGVFPAIVPTTYRPSTFNATHVRGRELRFIQNDPVSGFMNRINTTYRLFGKTYYVQPNGTRVELPEEFNRPYFHVKKNLSEVPKNEESVLNESNQSDMLASSSNSVPVISDAPTSETSANEISSSVEDEKEPFIVRVTEPSQIISPNAESEEGPPGDISEEESEDVVEKDVGRWSNNELNFDEVVRTGALVVRSRGVPAAFLDAVSIIYDCVHNHWNSGIVRCLTEGTARLLDATLGEGEEEDGDTRPRDYGLEEDTSQGRKKGLKKLFHPFGMLLRLKFLFVLIAVALLAGKAAVLSFGSFAMTMMMYMKKTPSHSHSHGEHVTLYPQPSFHNKRFDDPGVVSAIAGGRDFYM